MRKYIIDRFIQMLIVLAIVSLIVFVLFAMLPGDYLDNDPFLTEVRRGELAKLYGFDKPLLVRYFHWLGHSIRGNFGDSLHYRMPVLELLGTYFKNSLLLTVTASVLAWGMAIAVGVYSAVKRYSKFDVISTALVFAAMSLPSFFMGLMLVKIFAIDLRLLPVGSMVSSGSRAAGLAYLTDVLSHMILPVTVLALLSVGSLTRYFRSGMLDVIKQDYVRTARAKGLRERAVILRHAMKNALLPAITLLGFKLPGLFSGAIITERIFNWPGIGYIQMEALYMRDYPVLMAFTMIFSLLTIIGSFLADVAYAFADPRIKLGNLGGGSKKEKNKWLIVRLSGRRQERLRI
ncbi:MAG: ABC transporter permease [Synergistaceae bacterium]|jgi:peptide/nickel transport system permease protein|nr:ABC transporter permease [Synergistaceae bacterium]